MQRWKPATQASPSTSSSAPEPNSPVQISATPEDDPPNQPVQISVTPNAKVTLRIRVPGDILLHYRQLERLHRQKLPGESFIQFLCATLWQTWVPTLGVSDKWGSIYRRDRYRCTSPVCHLEGEHGGRLRILPPGNDPTWLLGRQPIIRAHRRERTLLN